MKNTKKEYPEPFEGTINIENVIAERDELDDLLQKANDRIFELEQYVKLIVARMPTITKEA